MRRTFRPGLPIFLMKDSRPKNSLNFPPVFASLRVCMTIEPSGGKLSNDGCKPSCRAASSTIRSMLSIAGPSCVPFRQIAHQAVEQPDAIFFGMLAIHRLRRLHVEARKRIVVARLVLTTAFSEESSLLATGLLKNGIGAGSLLFSVAQLPFEEAVGGKPLAARRKVNTMREVKSHMVDARHHKAGRDGPIVVLVPIPVGGSPEPFRQVKPRYPVQQRREHWRPQRAIPSKAAASVNLLRQIIESDAAARSMLRPRSPAPR
jgi:hypothetical protein